MPRVYNIVFKRKNQSLDQQIGFTDIESFIDRFLTQKQEFLNKKIKVTSEIDDIDPKTVENLWAFLNFYLETKQKCAAKMQAYNKKLTANKANEEIKRAMREFARMNGNGKFLRAALVALGYQNYSDQNDYLALALAVEVFQTSILIHDDIIDKADTRRGNPTIPVSYKQIYSHISSDFKDKQADFANSMALCIGDLGFYLADELIVTNYSQNKQLSKILSYYHQIAIKTCMGEMMDVTLPFKATLLQADPDLETKIMEVYTLKTAWYSVVGPYCLGMILGGALEEEIKQMEKILLNVGIAFQIKDDILGIYGDANHLGKPINSDIEECKQTLLYAYAMQTEYKNILMNYYGKSPLKIEDIDQVKTIFTESGAEAYALNQMNAFFQKGLKDLDDTDFLSEDHKNLLKGFICYLQNRSK